MGTHWAGGGALALPVLFTVGLALAAGAASAQTVAKVYKPPRTSYGAPDLEGVWNNSSITTLERPSNISSLVMTEDQAAELERRMAGRLEAGDAPTDPNAPPPKAGQDPGGYNQAWWDQGAKVGRVRGEARSSWLISPADGKLPYTPAARKMVSDQYAASRGGFDNPEQRAPAERCLLGYGSTAGPPMLNVGYNNNYQIVQTPQHVAIVVEMIHDARIVRMNSREHLPPNVRPWMGDSVGWWEGDTLVVETTNFNPSEGLRISGAFTYLISQDAKVIERFTRVGKDELLYAFEVHDPAIFTEVWRAEMPMKASDQRLFEYACAEGNHSLEGILAGARQAEEAQAKPKLTAN